MTEIASLDKSGTNIFAVGFDSHTEAIDWIYGQINQGNFSEADIYFKDSLYQLTGFEERIRNLYISLFGSESRVYFKDYVTDDTISINPDLANLPYGNKYAQTFFSLLYHLQHPFPKFLVFYKV